MFLYDRCEACHSLTLTNPPDDIGSYYDWGYYSFQTRPRYPASRSRLSARALRTASATLLPIPFRTRLFANKQEPSWMSWLPPLHPRARVLDVGSGSGSLVNELRDNGLTNAIGYDPFSPGGDHVVSTWPSGSFDLIMYNHSLEHMDDPNQELRRALARLRRFGAILIRVPLADSQAAEERGVDWTGLDPPRHLWVPTRKGLAELARSAGLRITRSWFDEELDAPGDAGGILLKRGSAGWLSPMPCS